MDPRHDPRKKRERREAAARAREAARCAAGAEKNKELLLSLEGAICAEMMKAGPGGSVQVMRLAQDYLRKGLPLSEKAREFLSHELSSGKQGPWDEKEFVVDLLRGATAILAPGLKKVSYSLLSAYDASLDMTDAQEATMRKLLDRALCRGEFSFKA